MNNVKIYKLIKEVYDGLEYLVEPVVNEDVRDERQKLLEIMKYLENDNTGLTGSNLSDN